MVQKNLFQRRLRNSKENIADNDGNVDANARSTCNSNMNSKQIKGTKLQYRRFMYDNRINFIPGSIIELESKSEYPYLD